jgi:hypothetical protein
MFNGPNTVTDGLVFWLDAANNKSYISGSLIWNNLTKGTNSCSFDNAAPGRMPEYSSANGGEIKFNTTSSAFNSLGLSSNYPYPYHTFEIWVKSAGLGPGMTLAGLFGMDYGRYIHIAPSTPNFIQYTLASGSTTLFNVYASMPDMNIFDNVYHQVVCLRNSSSCEVYVDGIIKASGSAGITGPGWDGLNQYSSLVARLGNNPNNAFYRLSGSIAIAKIYNRGLTRDEVIQNYNATKGRLGR